MQLIDVGVLRQRENQSLASRHVELTEFLNRQLGHEVAPQFEIEQSNLVLCQTVILRFGMRVAERLAYVAQSLRD